MTRGVFIELNIEYTGSKVECKISRINPDNTIYLSECEVNGKKVLDKSTEDGYYHYGTLVLTNEEYADKLGKNIEVALKDYYEENNKYPINYRLLDLPTLDKDVNCVSKIHQDGTVYLTKCSIDGSYIMNKNEEDGYYHYGRIYDYIDKDGNGYIEVEYLESTGTQYIDTQYYADENTNAIYKIEVEQYKKWGPHLLTGQYYAFPFYRNEGPQLVATRNQISLRQYDTSFYPNKIFEYKAFWNNKFFINDEEKGTLEGSSGKDIKPLFIGTAALDPSNTSYTLIGKIYYVKIYNNDNLVRDYIPVIDSSEKPCLFDKVEHKCYYNQGTGEFLYG